MCVTKDYFSYFLTKTYVNIDDLENNFTLKILFI